MWKPSARALGVLSVVAALVAVPGLPAAASASGAPATIRDAPAGLRADPVFPSWDEVNAAKQNVQATQAEVAKIQSQLTANLQAADAANTVYLQRGQEYLKAKYDAEAAAGYAATLAAQAATATADADKANTQVGQLAAQLYRNGGDSTVNLILNQGDSTSLLYRLGAMSKLTEQTAGIRNKAVQAQNTADALNSQADVAKTARDALEQEASQAKDAAASAKTEADAAVALAQSQNAQMTAQLASLKQTSESVEAGYQAGLVYQAQKKASEAAAAAAAAAASGATDNPLDSAWVPDSSAVASPADAQAYAASQMSSYGWGGGQFGCLVSLWTGESGWQANAYNASSGAYGIPQSLPASKMATMGADYVTNAATQINWGLAYISDVYGTPCEALSQWTARSPHWY
ncbi:hypothetical protein VD659_17365 [Herbiconiux sp. 11R-BC]|uniref:coiled-coil domain-containing protein n=1 Tax=Herbiconiux sp. 11R-BC TaxID=3111637 RepID=UPI003C125481